MKEKNIEIIKKIIELRKKWIDIQGFKSKRRMTTKEIAENLNINIRKCRYLIEQIKNQKTSKLTPEQKELKRLKEKKRKEYNKLYREKQEKILFSKLKRNIRSFQRKSICPEPFTAEDVIKKFGLSPSCYLTGLPINYEDTSTYHLDHFVPIKLGGNSSLENLRLCHPVVNQMKGGCPTNEFINFCKLVYVYSETHLQK